MKEDKVEISIEDSIYAPQKMLLIRVNGQEVVRQFLNNQVAEVLKKWVGGINLRRELEQLEEGRPSSNMLIDAARNSAKWLREDRIITGFIPTLLEDLADHIKYLELVIKANEGAAYGPCP